MTENFCEYCQEDTEHQLNKHSEWECTECEPLYNNDMDTESDTETDYSEYETNSEWWKYITYMYVMVKSYCVKEKKQTECVVPSGYEAAKNGRLMFFCTCASCGITKTKFVKNQGS